MRMLKDYGGIQPFRLTEILRQENPDYRAAAKLLSEGKTLEGFDAIDAMGRVAEIADDADRNRHIAADYVQALDDKKSVLVVSPTHAEAKAITAAIRSELRAAGQLAGEDREFTRLVPVDSTEAERGQAEHLPGRADCAPVPPELPGRLHQGPAAHRHRSGDGAAASMPAKFSLYRPETIALAEGDRIRFTGNVENARRRTRPQKRQRPDRHRLHRSTATSGSITAG